MFYFPKDKSQNNSFLDYFIYIYIYKFTDIPSKKDNANAHAHTSLNSDKYSGETIFYGTK